MMEPGCPHPAVGRRLRSAPCPAVKRLTRPTKDGTKLFVVD